MNIDQMMEQCQQADLRVVRFLYCDNSGLIRGKCSSLADLKSNVKNGINLPLALTAANNLDRVQYLNGIGPVGEVRLVPDLESFGVLTYVPRTASFCCDIFDLDRTPWAGCSRSFLRSISDRALSRGLSFRAAFETEFTLAQRLPDGNYMPFNETLTYSSIGMTMAAKLIDDLLEALEVQGLRVEQYHPECAYGLHEISISHAGALQAADNHIKVRETVRGIAWKHGLYASFAPKLWPEKFGPFAQNSAHIHFSLWSESLNLFYDSITLNNLSDIGRMFLAGVLAHLPALIALTCPSVNSYRRLTQKGNLSGAVAAYGHNNREVALRVVRPTWNDPDSSLNLELRPVDSSCNPYLALGGLLVAGIDGLDRKLELGEPVDVNPANLSGEQREKLGLISLPTSLDDAVNALERDKVLVDALGGFLASLYIGVRRSEADAYRDKDVDFEINNHFYKY